jgi:hypothetical protein
VFAYVLAGDGGSVLPDAPADWLAAVASIIVE